jgi:hypothetical protein
MEEARFRAWKSIGCPTKQRQGGARTSMWGDDPGSGAGILEACLGPGR